MGFLEICPSGQSVVVLGIAQATLSACSWTGADGEACDGLHPGKHVHLEVEQRGCGEHLTDQSGKAGNSEAPIALGLGKHRDYSSLLARDKLSVNTPL